MRTEGGRARRSDWHGESRAPVSRAPGHAQAVLWRSDSSISAYGRGGGCMTHSHLAVCIDARLQHRRKTIRRNRLQGFREEFLKHGWSDHADSEIAYVELALLLRFLWCEDVGDGSMLQRPGRKTARYPSKNERQRAGKALDGTASKPPECATWRTTCATPVASLTCVTPGALSTGPPPCVMPNFASSSGGGFSMITGWAGGK
eukprot:scaffold138699_cov31-Tisochrysis_lutea.AAC.2